MKNLFVMTKTLNKDFEKPYLTQSFSAITCTEYFLINISPPWMSGRERLELSLYQKKQNVNRIHFELRTKNGSLSLRKVGQLKT